MKLRKIYKPPQEAIMAIFDDTMHSTTPLSSEPPRICKFPAYCGGERIRKSTSIWWSYAWKTERLFFTDTVYFATYICVVLVVQKLGWLRPSIPKISRQILPPSRNGDRSKSAVNDKQQFFLYYCNRGLLRTAFISPIASPNGQT